MMTLTFISTCSMQFEFNFNSYCYCLNVMDFNANQ